jgi:hypothetical protein
MRAESKVAFASTYPRRTGLGPFGPGVFHLIVPKYSAALAAEGGDHPWVWREANQVAKQPLGAWGGLEAASPKGEGRPEVRTQCAPRRQMPKERRDELDSA